MRRPRICRLGVALAPALTFLLLGGPAGAQGEIVYAGRYYHAPGSGRLSHFHLFRISADGTGRQRLTSGSSEDHNPRWSPDGQRIVFIRESGESGSASSPISVCVVQATGGAVVFLHDAIAA